MKNFNFDEEILICNKVINNFGEAIQKVIAMEELSELIQAISKSLRDQDHNVEEEIADVDILLTQLKIMYDMKKVEEFRNSKLNRLERIVY